MDEDGGVNAADVVSGAGGLRSVGGIAEDNCIDLAGIVFLACGRGAPKCNAGVTISTGATGGEMYMSGVVQGIED